MNVQRAKAIRKKAIATGYRDWKKKYRQLKKAYNRGER